MIILSWKMTWWTFLSFDQDASGMSGFKFKSLFMIKNIQILSGCS